MPTEFPLPRGFQPAPVPDRLAFRVGGALPRLCRLGYTHLEDQPGHDPGPDGLRNRRSAH
jgi:hypothetical protein